MARRAQAHRQRDRGAQDRPLPGAVTSAGPVGPPAPASVPVPAPPVPRPAGRAARRFPVPWARLRTALRRTPVSMWNDDVTDWAAALTYYAILALLPALLMTVSLIGLVSPHTTDVLIEHVTAWAPAESGDALHGVLRDLSDQRSAALTVAVAGGVSALWSASSYLAVFRRALHAQHGVEDCRPVLRTVPRILLTATALLALLVASALLLVVSGSLVESAGRRAGLGNAGATVWELVRWPALLCLVALLVLVLFRSGPPAARGLRHGLPGGVLAALLWLAASAGFTLYASGLGTYSRLYGSLAGVIVFLVWLWVSNLSLLAGAQFTVELRRTEGRGPAPARA